MGGVRATFLFLWCLAAVEQLLSKSFLSYQASLFLVLWVEKGGVVVVIVVIVFVCACWHFWVADFFSPKLGYAGGQK